MWLHCYFPCAALSLLLVFLPCRVQAGKPESPVAGPEERLCEVAVAIGEGPARRISWSTDLSESDASIAGEEGFSSTEAVWIWSEAAPPRRLELDIGTLDEGDLAASCEPSSDQLDILVEALPEGIVEGMAWVVAGPPEIWREVPEPLLPRWPVRGGMARVPVGGELPLRLRLVADHRGSSYGSPWVDHHPSRGPVVLSAAPAPDVAIAIVDDENQPVREALIQLLQRGSRSMAELTHYVSGTGQVEIRALPRGQAVDIIARAPGHLERYLEITSDRFPSLITLDRGCRLSGSATTLRGEPLPGVGVEAEGFLPGHGLVAVRRRGVSGPDGTWTLEALPRDRIVVEAERTGFVPQRLEIDLSPCQGSQELRTLALERGGQLRVLVKGRDRLPVEGAEVSTADGSSAVTAPDGTATLEDVALRRPSTLSVTARGFLPREIVAETGPGEVRVVLSPTARVRGRLLDEEGRPVGKASVRIWRGQNFRDEAISPNGAFELEIEPAGPLDLRFRSRRTLEVTRSLPSPEGGEEIDLGDIVAPRGVTLRGTLLGSDDQPVAGARVWSERQGPEGGIVAWYHEDRLETASDVEGVFELSGLLGGPVSLQVDARGFAPWRRSFFPEAVGEEGHGVVDIGTVYLEVGARVEVLGDQEWIGTLRVHPEGSWKEAAIVSAPFYGGAGVVEDIPAGSHSISIRVEGEIVCESPLEVATDEHSVSVECVPRRLRVSGPVTVGGRPSGRGTLMWSWAGERQDSMIVNHKRPSGLVRQRVFGVGRGSVAVEVYAEGRYETDEIAPGAWQVSWVSELGAFSSPRKVEIPKGVEEVVLPLELSPWSLRGRVVDEDGQPVVLARVETLTSHATAMTGESGEFELLDLAPGHHTVVASKGRLGSDPREIEVGSRGEVPEIVLMLERSRAGLVEIKVFTEDSPGRGAIVFLETLEGGLRVYSADASGVAEAILPSPRPLAVRAATMAQGRWSFGPWFPVEQALEEGITLRPSADARLEIHTSAEMDSPMLLAPEGWDLGDLLRRLGAETRLGPTAPLVITGLPSGSYSVRLGLRLRSVIVEAGEIVRVELE